MHSSIKGNLLSLTWFFCRKEAEESLEGHSFIYLWMLWMKRNRRLFEDIEQSDQAIKPSFMCIFLDWVKVYMNDYSLTMIGFINWWSIKIGTGRVFFCFLSSFLLARWYFLYKLCTWCILFEAPLIHSLFCLLKKKLNKVLIQPSNIFFLPSQQQISETIQRSSILITR